MGHWDRQGGRSDVGLVGCTGYPCGTRGHLLVLPRLLHVEDAGHFDRPMGSGVNWKCCGADSSLGYCILCA